MRVLVVEDDVRIASFVAKGLREASFAVDVSTDGDDALYRLAIADYDAVVLDVMIPGKTGIEVCREMRAIPLDTPVLFLTARDAVDDRILGLDSGADDYLTKPFAFGELLARLRALMRRNARVLPTQISVGDLVIDTAAQKAWRGDSVIKLTPKEYALLEYLARNVGKLVGRAAIAEHVWDENFDPMSNVIDVYIRRLRAKMDDGFTVQLIHTRRGLGYILEG